MNNFYEYIVISGEDINFQNNLSKASMDGWTVEHINSFPVEKPDMISHSVSIVIIYTAVLKRETSKKYISTFNNADGDK